MIQYSLPIGIHICWLFVELNVALFPCCSCAVYASLDRRLRDQASICLPFVFSTLQPLFTLYISQPAILGSFKCFGALRWLRCLLYSALETEFPPVAIAYANHEHIQHVWNITQPLLPLLFSLWIIQLHVIAQVISAESTIGLCFCYLKQLIGCIPIKTGCSFVLLQRL